MNTTLNLTLVIFTSQETASRLRAFEAPCARVRCIAVSNSIRSVVGSNRELETVSVRHPCAYRLHRPSNYILGSIRYMFGYALLKERGMIGTDWALLVDDDVTVQLESAGFLGTLDPSTGLALGDFDNMGLGNFACGGGGFLLSRVAFYSLDFRACSLAHVCERGGNLLYGDHSFAACLDTNRGVQRIGGYSCGTCGNQWSPLFTWAALASGRCQFMHNQRSHSPARYREDVRRNTPLVLHRAREFNFDLRTSAGLGAGLESEEWMRSREE
jgi:hypothetical protein